MEETEAKEDVMTEWVQRLEERLKSRKRKLGHELGAGAKCFVCKEECPGLDLHFWRKICNHCKCLQNVHDVEEDETVRFDILFRNKGVSNKYQAVKSVLEVKVKTQHKNTILQQFGDSEVVKRMKFDWIPPAISPMLAADYMNELPSNRIPISGSEGAKYRKIQLKKQIPMHDIMPEEKEVFTNEEKLEFDKYLENLRENAGIGKILRIKQIQFCEKSTPYDTQPVQSSGAFKPKSTLDELNSGLKNINIQPQQMLPPPPGFHPLVSDRPLNSVVNVTPRTALRNLPQTIPGTILRLPSSFQQNQFILANQFQPMLRDDTLSHTESGSNASYADCEETNDSIDITGVSPLPVSPVSVAANEDGQLSAPGASTPLDFPNPISTPSKTAARVSHPETHTPPPGFNRQRILTSSDLQNNCDFQNANAGAMGDLPGTDTRKQYESGYGSFCNNLATPRAEYQNSFASDKENANSFGGAEVTTEDSDEVHRVDKRMLCVECKQVIEFNSIAVLIDKPGYNAAWHPKCFVCWECKEMLVDLMYFFHKGNVYCARDFTEKLKIHRCVACDELIFVKEYTLAEGNFYHCHHFCCHDCDVELAGKNYVLNERNGNAPTCLKCFDEKYAKRCSTCGGPIKAEEPAVCFRQSTFHAKPECFRCFAPDCHKSLENTKFLFINEKTYCSRECSKKPIS